MRVGDGERRKLMAMQGKTLAGAVAKVTGTLPDTQSPVLLVLAHEGCLADVEELLRLPQFAGVVVPESVACHFEGEQRVGVIREDGTWSLPQVGARSLLFPSGTRLLNAKRSLHALRRGLGHVLRVDDRLHLVSSPLWRWTVLRLYPPVVRTLVRLLPVRPGVLGGGVDRGLEHGLSLMLKDVPGPSVPIYDVGDNILLVNNSLAAGGAERQLVNTARYLSEEGREVSVLCYQLGTDEYDFHLPAVGPGVQVGGMRSLVEIVGSLSSDRKRSLQKQMAAVGLQRLAGLLPAWVVDDVILNVVNLLQQRPRIVHFWQDYTNVVGGLAAAMVGVPRIVLGMRNMAPHRFPYFQSFMEPMYRVLARLDNVVFVNNSTAGARDYASWLGMAPQRIRVVLNGVAEPARATRAEAEGWRVALGLPPKARVVGSVFRFWPEKDPMLWLETVALVARQHPDVVFVLVGDGPMRRQMQRHAATLGIAERLFMPGVTRDAHIPLSVMDVFLLTSRVEGTPNVLIEAQMLGVPVVTTVAGGSAETVEPGRTGWVVEERDPQRLAERVLAVLGDEDWRIKAAAAAPDFARTRFGIERMVAETREVYGL